jgi:hypothetical protein
MGIEDPDADVVEQRRLATPADQDENADVDELAPPPLEADPADVIEQHRDVPYGDEDEDEPG